MTIRLAICSLLISVALPGLSLAQTADTQIVLTGLTGGEVLQSGETVAITWTSIGAIDHVRLKYKVPGQKSVSITKDASNTGEFLWTIPIFFATTEFKIKINARGPNNEKLAKDKSTEPVSVMATRSAETFGFASGTFWEYGWAMTSSFSSPDGTSTDVDSGRFRVTLGEATSINGVTAFLVDVTGKHEDVDGFDYAPGWSYLASEEHRIHGSTDGVTLQLLFDGDLDEWNGGGFFATVSSETVVQANPAMIDNEFIQTSGIAVSRSASQSMCEVIEGVGTVCPNDTAFTFNESEFYKRGIGPVAYRQSSSAEFSGGGFGSFSSTTRNLGLGSTSLIGEDGFTATGFAWTEKAPMPTTRSRFSVDAVNGKIYVIGGLADFDPVSTVEEYDPTTDTWAAKTPMPTARFNHHSGVVNGRIYILGGESDDGSTLDIVEVYDPFNDSWTSAPSLLVQRADSVSCTVDTWIFLVDESRDVILYVTDNGDTLSLNEPLPGVRFRPACSATDTHLYVVGGLVSASLFDGPSTSGATMELDLSTGQWAFKAPMPTTRQGHTMHTVDGTVFAIGGFTVFDQNRGQLRNTVEEYDPDTDTWTMKSGMLAARHSHGSAVIDGKIYVFGGLDGGDRLTSVEEYDPANDRN